MADMKHLPFDAVARICPMIARPSGQRGRAVLSQPAVDSQGRLQPQTPPHLVERPALIPPTHSPVREGGPKLRIRAATGGS
jgi:hypothetical protein